MSVRALIIAIAIVVCTAAGAGAARADTHRIAVVVGHNSGDAGEPVLRFAEDDAGKLADVLIQLGDVKPADLFLVQGKGAASVGDAITAAAAAVKAARVAPDDRVVLYFYYSGHSDGVAIELARERITYADLKARLAATGADVRVLIVDACKSGAITAKGGVPGPAFDVDLVDDLGARGEAMLTSSAADEQSLESSEVRGSFFTHHLVSGLRGAADSDGDGRVTLSEAYEYAFGKTVTASAAAGASPQHPSYDYRLSGRGELVLTEVGARTAAIELPAGFERALVVAVARDQIIAEVTSDAARRVALAPGTYAVRLWRKGAVVAGRVVVADGAVASVRWDDLRPVDATVSVAKGAAASSDDDPLDGRLTADEQRAYDEQMLTFGERPELVVTHGSGTLGWEYVTYETKYGREISIGDFLRKAGRSDLADRYEDREHLKDAVGSAGIIAFLGGIIYFAAKHCSDPNQACFDEDDRILERAAIVSGVGVALTAVAIGIPHDRPSPEQMNRLADDHNEKVRERVRGGAPGVSLNVAPYVAPGGGGALVSGSF